MYIFFGLLLLLKRMISWPISIVDCLQKGHISCAYASCSYFCMGERNGFYDIKIPVWGITDGSGVQMAEQSATPPTPTPTSQKVMLLAVNR
jgi:hypothetical protein